MCKHTSSKRVFLAFVVLTGVSLAAARGDESRKVYKQTVRATALIRARTGTGTGWIVDRGRRLLVTNHHVVLNAETVNVIFPQNKDGQLLASRSNYAEVLGVPARVVNVDTERDLAVLQVEILPAEAGELKLAAESATPGDRVHFIGNPGASQGLWEYTAGRVRQVYQRDFLQKVGTGLVKRKAFIMETQSATNHGDSGGPGVNDEGELIGVVSSVVEINNGELVHGMNLNIDVREVRAAVQETLRLLEPRTAADFALRAEKALQRGQLNRVETDLAQALKLDKNHANAFRTRGLLFMAKGDQQTAMADLTRAIELNGADAMAYFHRARAHERAKAPTEKIVADYTRAIQLNPELAVAYNNRGVAQENQGNLKLALADYQRAIEIDAGFAIAYVNRGDVYRKAGDFKKALGDYEQAYRLGPSAHGVTMLAFTHGQLGNNAEALRFCEFSLRNLNADYPVTWRVRGEAHEKLGQYQDAATSYSEAIKRGSNDLWVYLRRGTAYEELGDARASADYDQVVKLDPKMADKFTLHNRRRLRLANKTKEPLRVFLFYETLTEDNTWYWYPESPPDGKPLTLELQPDQVLDVQDNTFKVSCRRMRIWAESTTTNRKWTARKTEDYWLSRTEYRAGKMMTLTYSFSLK
jgi:tetratricopeptide (TPR) repeat protein